MQDPHCKNSIRGIMGAEFASHAHIHKALKNVPMRISYHPTYNTHDQYTIVSTTVDNINTTIYIVIDILLVIFVDYNTTL